MWFYIILVFSYEPLGSYFSSVHVSCISYDGSTWLYGVGVHNNNGLEQGGLDFLDGPYAYLFSSIQYRGSKVYSGAEELFSDKSGMSLSIMPDRLHGNVEVWKNAAGDRIIPVNFPVLCFKTKR